jgi:DNA-binding winged helix-turn-helix (wHTH) protein
MTMASFWIGPWRVDPVKNVFEQAGHRLRVEPKAMRVLVYLAERAGEAVTREEILRVVWDSSPVKAEVLTNAIWELRKALGDDPQEPEFIQTVSRVGYRIVASVEWKRTNNGAFSRVSIWLRGLVRPERSSG